MKPSEQIIGGIVAAAILGIIIDEVMADKETRESIEKLLNYVDGGFKTTAYIDG